MHHLDIQIGLDAPAVRVGAGCSLGLYYCNGGRGQSIGCVIFVEVGLCIGIAASIDDTYSNTRTPAREQVDTIGLIELCRCEA